MNALASAVTHIADFREGLGWGISEPLAGTTSGRRDRRNFVICARYSEAAELRLPEGKVRCANHQGEAMPRPYFQASIKGLEALFEQHADDTGLLAALLDELEQRKTPKAISLKDRVVKRLAAKKTGADASSVGPAPMPEAPRQPELPLDTTASATRWTSPAWR